MVIRKLIKEEGKEEIKKLDNEMDHEIYKLYGIAEEEKKIVEDSSK